MSIDSMTIGELKEISKLLNGQKDHPYKVGGNYLIRTVTMTIYGELVAVYSDELVLKDAAWIADTGRFSDALVSGIFDEVEPFPDGEMIVGRGAVIDAISLLHPLARKQK